MLSLIDVIFIDSINFMTNYWVIFIDINIIVVFIYYGTAEISTSN